MGIWKPNGQFEGSGVKNSQDLNLVNFEGKGKI